MKTTKFFLLIFLFIFVVLVQCADARLITIRIEGIVGPDVPAVGGEEADDAIYEPLDLIWSEDDPMTMTLIIDLSAECDLKQETWPIHPEIVSDNPGIDFGECPESDCGWCCYYHGSVVAMTVVVGDYRADYGRADPYLFPPSVLDYPDPETITTYDYGYSYDSEDDLFQYIKVHDNKFSFNPVDPEDFGFVDHFMMEQRLMFGTGEDLLLWDDNDPDYWDDGIDSDDYYLDGEYEFKIIGCSFAVTESYDHPDMFDDTDLPDWDLPIDTNDPQEYLCRWAVLFGRWDKIKAEISNPYKVQGVVTSYEVIDTDTKTVNDPGDCFIKTAAYGSNLEPHVKILREFRERFLLNK